MSFKKKKKSCNDDSHESHEQQLNPNCQNNMHVDLICTNTNHIANSYKPTIDSPRTYHGQQYYFHKESPAKSNSTAGPLVRDPCSIFDCSPPNLVNQYSYHLLIKIKSVTKHAQFLQSHFFHSFSQNTPETKLR